LPLTLDWTEQTPAKTQTLTLEDHPWFLKMLPFLNNVNLLCRYVAGVYYAEAAPMSARRYDLGVQAAVGGGTSRMQL
jgi:hypothetical protein